MINKNRIIGTAETSFNSVVQSYGKKVELKIKKENQISGTVLV